MIFTKYDKGVSMTTQQMRVYISQHPLYKGSMKWKAKCMTMPERQVIAIYNKFKQQDFKKIEKEVLEREKQKEQYHQIDMFEYMEEVCANA